MSSARSRQWASRSKLKSLPRRTRPAKLRRSSDHRLLIAEEKGVPRPPALDLVQNALCALRNNEVKVTKEVKAPSFGGIISGTSVTTVDYPKELVAAFRGMFGALKEYRFEMRVVTALSTTAGGALIGALRLSPSVSSYAVWSAHAALFDEVKAIGSKIVLASTNAPASATTAFEMPMAIACDHVNLSSTPASTLAVIRLADSSTFNTTLCVKPYVKTVKFAGSERLWCITGTPYSQDPLGGCIGTWSYANQSVGGGSTLYLSAITRTYVKLRCRA
jgi:hypothetical protein